MSSWSSVARDVEHRPFPRPAEPWVMTMSWLDLAFLHWEVDPQALRALVPAALPLDLYRGRAFLGVVPFRMAHVKPRALPDVPGISAFCELNVRTYVSLEGRPGVYFFSLDATQPLAIWGARTFFHLNYLKAEMACERRGDVVEYRSVRTDRRGPPGRFRARYRPTGPSFVAAPGSLEEFLTERYCLYSVDGDGRPFRGDIQHGRWPLRPGACEIEEDTVVPVPLERPIERSGAPLVHFVDGIDVVGWWPVPAGRG
jgi:uncharacterized protein YqjF (DUF2071 family)